ncbi:unnamed protein product [Ectocarpus sp. 13 AM-2016]
MRRELAAACSGQKPSKMLGNCTSARIYKFIFCSLSDSSYTRPQNYHTRAAMSRLQHPPPPKGYKGELKKQSTVPTRSDKNDTAELQDRKVFHHQKCGTSERWSFLTEGKNTKPYTVVHNTSAQKLNRGAPVSTLKSIDHHVQCTPYVTDVSCASRQ